MKNIPGNTDFGTDQWWPRLSVLRVGNIVYMRGWLKVLVDLRWLDPNTDGIIAELPSPLFYPDTWDIFTVYAETPNGVANLAVQYSTGRKALVMRGTAPAGSTLFFDGIFYSAAPI